MKDDDSLLSLSDTARPSPESPEEDRPRLPSSLRLLLGGLLWMCAALALCLPFAPRELPGFLAGEEDFQLPSRHLGPTVSTPPAGVPMQEMVHAYTDAERHFLQYEQTILNFLYPQLRLGAAAGMPSATFSCVRREDPVTRLPRYICTGKGQGAPLRLAVALRRRLGREGRHARKEDGSPLFPQPLLPYLRWRDDGALELRSGDAVILEMRFPGRERELTDLARPQPQPSLIIVIDDMGQKTEAAERLAALPYPVTFAVWPHAPHRKETVRLAGDMGLDILAHIPMEALPAKGKTPDPGPRALRMDMDAAQLSSTLNQSLALLPTAVGFNNHMGSALTSNDDACRAIARSEAGRGYFILDSMTHPQSRLFARCRQLGIVSAARAVFLDNTRRVPTILANLALAASRARQYGAAIAIGHPYPETIEALQRWENLEGVAVISLRRHIWHLSGAGLPDAVYVPPQDTP